MSIMDPSPVGIVLGAQPFGQDFGRLDQEELAITV